MIAHGNEEVEPQARAHITSTAHPGARHAHLHLHCPTLLERIPAAYNQRQVVCSQMPVALGRMGIGIPS